MCCVMLCKDIPWIDVGAEPDSEAVDTSSLPRVGLAFPEEASSMEPGQMRKDWENEENDQNQTPARLDDISGTLERFQ